MTDAALVLFQTAPDADAPDADGPTAGPSAAPEWMDYQPPGPRYRRPTIRVFTDTMETGGHRFRVGTRVVVEPCAASPEFPAVYLVAFRDAGYALARLVPTVGGGYLLSYDNPAYAARAFTVHPSAARNVRVVARVRPASP